MIYESPDALVRVDLPEVCCKSKVGAGKVDFEGEAKVSLKVLERRSFCIGWVVAAVQSWAETYEI
jgi:hypothetical protein